ncbi:hypothetical protein G5I_11564 [Acromyrmex echinatior]|uniref:Uncharacterized protein n=1 Tax=Acromyrmex echinatior TaxID=103372 RepID=F4WZY6_ACREC|nr:hypothetical protein G5I_11564 [Acromyrmex echinatior]
MSYDEFCTLCRDCWQQKYEFLVIDKDKSSASDVRATVRITMTETTLRRMFDFNGCIDVTFERLARFVDTIDIKYTRFSNITSENIIRDSDIFSGHQFVDCELLALIFNK